MSVSLSKSLKCSFFMFVVLPIVMPDLRSLDGNFITLLVHLCENLYQMVES